MCPKKPKRIPGRVQRDQIYRCETMLVKKCQKKHGKRNTTSWTQNCGRKKSANGLPGNILLTDLESARHQIQTVNDACAKNCRLMISSERCVTMHENSSWVVQFTFAVHLASSTTQRANLISADTISTTSLASPPMIIQRSGVDGGGSRFELVWRS